jgi:hypothetical protein
MRVHILVQSGELTGSGWDEHIRRFPDGLLQTLEKGHWQKISLSDLSPESDVMTSSQIRREILRLQIRLETSIDEMI